MIVLNVSYCCKPGMRDEFLEMIMTEGIDASSRAETGNIRYDYFIPTDGSDSLLLLEKWKDAEALAEHATKPHFERLKELKSEYVDDTLIEKYESAEQA